MSESGDSILSSSDLRDIWEDITLNAGYNNPDVVATTKALLVLEDAKQISNTAIKRSKIDQRYLKQVQEIKNLQVI